MKVLFFFHFFCFALACYYSWHLYVRFTASGCVFVFVRVCVHVCMCVCVRVFIFKNLTLTHISRKNSALLWFRQCHHNHTDRL